MALAVGLAPGGEVPTVVYAKPAAAGEVLTWDHVAEMSRSRALSGPSTVQKDSMSFAIGKPLVVPVLRGEPIQWTHFDAERIGTKPFEGDLEALDACRAVVPGLAAEASVDAARERRWSKLPRVQKRPPPHFGEALVATADLPAFTALAAEHVRAVAVDRETTTPSLVGGNELPLVVGEKLRAPIKRGDPLTWQLFLNTPAFEQLAACVKAIRPRVEAAGSAARKTAISAFAASRPATKPAVARAAVGVTVVVAAAHIPEAAALEEGLLTTVDFPTGSVTASFVPGDGRKALLGARTRVPLQQGDPVLWQFIDGTGLAACEVSAQDAIAAARAAAAASEAKGVRP